MRMFKGGAEQGEVGTSWKLQQQRDLKIWDFFFFYFYISSQNLETETGSHRDSSTNQTGECCPGKHSLTRKVQEPAASNHLVSLKPVGDKKKKKIFFFSIAQLHQSF